MYKSTIDGPPGRHTDQAEASNTTWSYRKSRSKKAAAASRERERVISLTRRGGDIRLRVALPADLRRYVAEKGSIALSGVSLTVANVLPAGLEVALIPETIERTRLGALAPGDRVNVEVDLLARYLERLVGDRGPKPGRHRPRAGRT